MTQVIRVCLDIIEILINFYGQKRKYRKFNKQGIPSLQIY